MAPSIPSLCFRVQFIYSTSVQIHTSHCEAAPPSSQRMAPAGRSCREALVKQKGVHWAEQEVVNLSGCCPPIQRMDASLSSLRACRHLALSTNSIDKLGPLTGLDSLETLSLGRNCLKRLEGLEAVAGTLRQLWVSYNQLDRLVRCYFSPVCAAGVLIWRRAERRERSAQELSTAGEHPTRAPFAPRIAQAGVEKARGLRVLYASNNRIKDWAEVDRLGALPDLEDLLLLGNPIHQEAVALAGGTQSYRLEVLRRLPRLKKLDGVPVEIEELDAARGLTSVK